MKWILASERNPDKEGYYYTYRHENKIYAQMTFWYADKKEWSSYTYEWLSEDSPEAVPKEKFYAVEYSGFWNIQLGGMYGDKNILDAETVGEKESEQYANLIADLLNKHYDPNN